MSLLGVGVPDPFWIFWFGHPHYLDAAQAVSGILSTLGISHAFIGCFAVRLLGCSRVRNSRADVEVVEIEVDTTDAVALRERLKEGDSRLSMHNNKLVFTSLESGAQRIRIELLGAGDLGLPQTLETLDVTHDGKLFPVLDPALLVLTKIKRCVMHMGSLGPASKCKFQYDIGDIDYLLLWLKERDQTIDFAGYHCTDTAAKDKLYMEVARLAKYYERKDLTRWVRYLLPVLSDEDKGRVLSVDTTEERSWGEIIGEALWFAF